MQSLISKITRGVVRSRRLYHHHHPRGEVYTIHVREVRRVWEHLPLQSKSRFISVKAPKLPEGEPVRVPVPVPVPVSEPVRVPVPVPVQVSEPVSVPVPVVEPTDMAKPDPDPKEDDKVGEDLWNVVYSIFQKVILILSLLATICTICAEIKLLSGAEGKKFEEASRRNDQLLNAILLMLNLQVELIKEILHKLAADEKAKKESWFYKFVGYK